MDFKKMKTIAKAYIEPLPEGQEWYEERVAICNGCPLNTKNIPRDKLSLKDRVKMKTYPCDNGNHCTACGCCIERKCSVRKMECGLAEIGEKPKWGALEIPSMVDTTISIDNLTPGAGTITADATMFNYDFGETPDNKLQMRFDLKREKEFEVKSYRPGCSCTVVDSMEVVSGKSVIFDVSISTLSFRKGDNSRKLYIDYTDKSSGITKELTINLKVNKPNGK